MAKTIFKEKQHLLTYDFRWLFFAFIGLIGYIIIHLYLVRHLDLQAGEIAAGLGCIAFISGLIWLITHLSLRTTITKKGIAYKLKPLHSSKRLIAWTDIKSIQVVTHTKFSSWQNAYTNYYTHKKFTFNGHNGICVETHNGERIFIGSNNVEDLQKAMEEAIEKSKAELAD